MLTDEFDADVSKIADDRIHIAADITHFGEFGGFDFDEGCIGQTGETPRNFGFANAGRTNHEDVLWRDLVAQWLRHLLAPPAVTQRNRYGPLGAVLTDDVTIELGDDFGRRHLAGGAHPSMTSMTWW